MYREIQTELKSNLNDISDKVSYLVKSNYEINERIFKIEKETEKEEMNHKLSYESIKENDKECMSRVSCNVCVENTNCVWCSLNRKCLPGTSIGPTDGSCSIYFEFKTCSIK
jgi:hypothetical protein